MPDGNDWLAELINAKLAAGGLKEAQFSVGFLHDLSFAWQLAAAFRSQTVDLDHAFAALGLKKPYTWLAHADIADLDRDHDQLQNDAGAMIRIASLTRQGQLTPITQLPPSVPLLKWISEASRLRNRKGGTALQTSDLEDVLTDTDCDPKVKDDVRDARQVVRDAEDRKGQLVRIRQDIQTNRRNLFSFTGPALAQLAALSATLAAQQQTLAGVNDDLSNLRSTASGQPTAAGVAANIGELQQALAIHTTGLLECHRNAVSEEVSRLGRMIESITPELSELAREGMTANRALLDGHHKTTADILEIVKKLGGSADKPQVAWLLAASVVAMAIGIGAGLGLVEYARPITQVTSTQAAKS